MDQCVGRCDYLGVCPGGFISWEGGYLRTCYHVILFSSLSGIGYRCVCVCVYIGGTNQYVGDIYPL